MQALAGAAGAIPKIQKLGQTAGRLGHAAGRLGKIKDIFKRGAGDASTSFGGFSTVFIACWGCCVPCLTPFTSGGSWFFNMIPWVFRAGVLTFWSIRNAGWIPLILIAMFAGAAPFHESQQAIIQVLDIVWGCIDSI